MQQPPRHRLIYSSVVPERGQNVVHKPARLIEYRGSFCATHATFCFCRDVDQRRSERRLTSTGVMELNFDRETLAEHFLPFG